LHCSQPDAASGELGRGMESLKGLEQSIRRSRIEPGTIVPHEINYLSVLALNTEFNACMAVARGVLPK
jgi:hypothetical protein